MQYRSLYISISELAAARIRNQWALKIYVHRSFFDDGTELDPLTHSNVLTHRAEPWPNTLSSIYQLYYRYVSTIKASPLQAFDSYRQLNLNLDAMLVLRQQ